MFHLNTPRSVSFYFLVLFAVLFHLVDRSAALNSGSKWRTLMSIKEIPKGGNVTFDCSPSGPCVPCSRSEKRDKKYRCGETGYRIRLKCVAPISVPNEDKILKGQKTRGRLLANSSQSKVGAHTYITYRSCIPAVNDEKLSILGFEVVMLTLLISSGSFIFFRRRRASAISSGPSVRLPPSSRF